MERSATRRGWERDYRELVRLVLLMRWIALGPVQMGLEWNAIVPNSVTLRGCVQMGPLQIEPFYSKRWTYLTSDTKSAIGPFRSIPFPSEQTSDRMSKVGV